MMRSGVYIARKDKPPILKHLTGFLFGNNSMGYQTRRPRRIRPVDEQYLAVPMQYPFYLGDEIISVFNLKKNIRGNHGIGDAVFQLCATGLLHIAPDYFDVVKMGAFGF